MKLSETRTFFSSKQCVIMAPFLSGIFQALAGHCGLILSVQSVILAQVVVIPDTAAEGCILFCSMAVNSSMSVTPLTHPKGAISAQPLSGMRVHTVSQLPNPSLYLFLPLPHFSFPPAPLYLSPPILPLLLLSPLFLPCYQRQQRVLSPRSHPLRGKPDHTHEG